MSSSHNLSVDEVTRLTNKLFREIKGSHSVWVDVVKNAESFHLALKTVFQTSSTFFNTLQQVALLSDIVDGSNNNSDSFLTRLCHEYKSLEPQLRCLSNYLLSTLAIPLASKLRHWKTRLNQLEKERRRRYKRVRLELKRAQNEFYRCQKYAIRHRAAPSVSSDLNGGQVSTKALNASARVNLALETVQEKIKSVWETENSAHQNYMTEIRDRFCFLSSCLLPILVCNRKVCHSMSFLDDLIQSQSEFVTNLIENPAGTELTLSQPDVSDDRNNGHQSHSDDVVNVQGPKCSEPSLQELNKIRNSTLYFSDQFPTYQATSTRRSIFASDTNVLNPYEEITLTRSAPVLQVPVGHNGFTAMDSSRFVRSALSNRDISESLQDDPSSYSDQRLNNYRWELDEAQYASIRRSVAGEPPRITHYSKNSAKVCCDPIDRGIVQDKFVPFVNQHFIRNHASLTIDLGRARNPRPNALSSYSNQTLCQPIPKTPSDPGRESITVLYPNQAIPPPDYINLKRLADTNKRKLNLVDEEDCFETDRVTVGSINGDSMVRSPTSDFDTIPSSSMTNTSTPIARSPSDLGSQRISDPSNTIDLCQPGDHVSELFYTTHASIYSHETSTVGTSSSYPSPLSPIEETHALNGPLETGRTELESSGNFPPSISPFIHFDVSRRLLVSRMAQSSSSALPTPTVPIRRSSLFSESTGKDAQSHMSLANKEVSEPLTSVPDTMFTPSKSHLCSVSADNLNSEFPIISEKPEKDSFPHCPDFADYSNPSSDNPTSIPLPPFKPPPPLWQNDFVLPPV